jgi:hypothetical protein
MAKLQYASLSGVAITFLNIRAALETLIPYQHGFKESLWPWEAGLAF